MMKASAALALILAASAARADAYVPVCGSASTPCVTTQQASPSITGFTLTPREYFLYQGLAFVATTNLLTIPAADIANITVCNTYAAGGKSLYVFKRRFDNNVAYNGAAFSYGGISGAAKISDSATYSSATGAATTSGNNLVSGGTTSTGMTMTFAVGTARLSGTVNGAGYLPLSSDAYKLEEMRVIPPQTCFAQFIANATAGLGGAAAGAAFTMYWWEQ